MAQWLNIGRGDAIAEIIARLVRPGARWVKPELVPPDDVEHALEQLCSLGDERAVPCLVGLLGDVEPRIRKAATRTIDFLAPRDLTDLVVLESKIRDRGLYAYETWWPSDRPQLNPGLTESQARLAIAEGLPLQVLGVLSFNADGRIRELATRALAGLSSGEEVSFLLLRANDWVSQVMQPARNALLRRCTEQYAATFASALTLVEKVAAKRRVDHGWLVRAIHAILTETESGLQSVTRVLAGGGDRGTRRAAARLVHATEKVAPLQFQTGLADSDPIVRTLLVTASLERATTEQLQEWAPKFLADSSARIRALAFATAETKCPDLLASRLPTLLLDENVWLREFTRQKLSRSGPQDFRKIYLDEVAVGSPTTLRAALAGLGEVGAEEDAAFALPHVTTGPARTRRIALQAVHKLQKQRAAPTIFAALGGESVGVSKLATELILSGSSGVVADDLIKLTASGCAHVRANALRALAGTDRWEALIAGLQRISDVEPRVVQAADRILTAWRRIPASLYTRPSASQSARIRAALVTNGSSVPDVSNTLDAILGSA